MFPKIGLTARIMLNFWLTLVTFVSIITFILWVERDDEALLKSLHSPIFDQLQTQLVNRPFEEVQGWFASLDEKKQRTIFVLYNRQEILNRPLPRFLNKLNEELSSNQPFVNRFRERRIFSARLIELPNRKTARLFLISKPPHIPPLHNVVRDHFVIILFFGLLLSALISYLLARHISQPITRLRQATKRLASGQLDIRVSDSLKKSHGESYLLAQDFDNMAAQLERTMSSHKHLIQDISHELRSPIARLQLALELAKKHLNIADNQKDILRIEKECEQLNGIINTLLDLPSFELDPMFVLQDTVDISELMASLCDDLNFAHPNAPIELHNQLPPKLTLAANSQLLRSAIENVLKNAQHYQPENAGTPIQVTLTLTKHHASPLEHVLIRCCDQGPGVDEAHLQDIFKPFYRVSQARDRNSGGQGLGLAISQRAVALHNGEIYAQTNQAVGLCVCIALPMG